MASKSWNEMCQGSMKVHLAPARAVSIGTCPNCGEPSYDPDEFVSCFGCYNRMMRGNSGPAPDPAVPLSPCCQSPTFTDGNQRICKKCRCARPL